MYWTPETCRHARAVLAQKTGVPLLAWSGQRTGCSVNSQRCGCAGKYGTSVPLTDEICSVCLEPFPTSKYTIDQLESASRDYIAYIRTCFDKYKGCLPRQQHKQLVVIGANNNGNMTTSVHAKL